MPFYLLKQVISFIKKTCRCPSCKGRLCDDSIFVLTTHVTSVEGDAKGLFYVVCPDCLAHAFVVVESKNGEGGSISVNEILDMHNFLKTWQGGDLQELFKDA